MSTFAARFTLPVLLLVLLLLVLTGNFFSTNPLVIGGQIAGLALVVAARISFGAQKFNLTAQPAEGPLVQRGPYQYIRHPMYAGAMMLMLVTILGHFSAFTATLGILLLIMVVVRIETEEKLLNSRYPEYSSYARQTKKLVPFMY